MGRRRICDGPPAYSNWREMQTELAQFSTVSLVNRPAGVPVFACSRPYDEICKKKEEVGDDENSKKVLGAANVSRANKSQSMRIILFSQGCDSTTGNISSGIMDFLCIILITETQSEKKNTPEHQLNWQHYQ